MVIIRSQRVSMPWDYAMGLDPREQDPGQIDGTALPGQEMVDLEADSRVYEHPQWDMYKIGYT